MQPKKPLGLKKAPKLKPSRVREIADSLMESSKSKKQAAYQQNAIGKAAIKNGVGDKQLRVWGKDFGDIGTLSGRDRINIANRLRKEASSDSSESIRLRNLIKKK
jgi:hypothetical protein